MYSAAATTLARLRMPTLSCAPKLSLPYATKRTDRLTLLAATIQPAWSWKGN